MGCWWIGHEPGREGSRNIKLSREMWQKTNKTINERTAVIIFLRGQNFWVVFQGRGRQWCSRDFKWQKIKISTKILWKPWQLFCHKSYRRRTLTFSVHAHAASWERILINNSSKTYSPLCGMFQLRNHSSFVEKRHIEFAVEVPQPSGSQAEA